MKQIYIECAMGAAGDMLMAALLELYDEKQSFLEKMNSLYPEVSVKYVPENKGGIQGNRIIVDIHGHEEGHHHSHEVHEHQHHSLEDVFAIIEKFELPVNVLKNAKEVYNLLAEAESLAHGQSVSQIHFHEVGEIDAIVDITGVCYLFDLLSADKVVASGINVGSGTVKTAHGELPVPAPATTFLLEGIPFYISDIKGELCTPTGAVLLKYFVDEFGEMPMMTQEKIGYGMGKKDFGRANCVRAFLGHTNDEKSQILIELIASIDDMTPEAMSYSCNLLLESGALEVYTKPIYMKKNRQAFELLCLCKEEDSEKFIKLILKHTTSFGVRKRKCERFPMEIKFETIDTDYGQITKKIGIGFGCEKWKPEYEDVAKLAKENDVSIDNIIKSIKH